MGHGGYTRRMAQAPALPGGFELPLKQRLPRIGSIDQVAVEARAAELAKRSIKKDAKVWALELAIRCCDLTTLEGQDTPGQGRGALLEGASGPIRATRTSRRSRRSASTRTSSRPRSSGSRGTRREGRVASRPRSRPGRARST